jgi:hypothetical protein
MTKLDKRRYMLFIVKKTFRQDAIANFKRYQENVKLVNAQYDQQHPAPSYQRSVVRPCRKFFDHVDQIDDFDLHRKYNLMQIRARNHL